MKNLIYVAAFISLFSCKENATSGQERPLEDDIIERDKSPDYASESLRNLKNIDDIKQEHADIISKIESGSIDTTSFEYNCNGEKKGKVTYFNEDGQVRLIKHAYNEYSHFSATDEYYIKDDAPFFIFYDHLVWNFVDQNQTKDDVTEKRIYIIDGKPVKCFEKNFSILSNAENPLKSNMVSNKEIDCPSLEPELKNFRLLFKLREQTEDIDCMES